MPFYSIFEDMNLPSTRISPTWFTRGILLLTLLPLGFALAFCVVFLFSSYADLAAWYLQLNDCFYRAEVWAEQRFTPEVKSSGNWFCGLGIGLCLGLIVMAIRWSRRWKKNAAPPLFYPRPYISAINLLFLLLSACILWAWGQSITVPATDEVFSALYFSGLPFLQTLADYPLPNNHILFNLLNGLLASQPVALVENGRIISLLAYLLLIILAYRTLEELGLALASTTLIGLLIALQFPLWGFSFQARGYAVYALAHWLVFYSLAGFIFESGRIRYVPLTAGLFLGYASLPSFLYFHLGLVFYFLFRAVRSGKTEYPVWQGQGVAVVLVFLFYLPALSFSGIDSIVANPYVRPFEGSFGDFLAKCWPVLRSYPGYAFSNPAGFGFPISAIFFFLPLLFFLPGFSKRDRELAWFYVSLIVGFLLLVLLMRRYPFHRNLLGQFSLILTISLFAWTRTMIRIGLWVGRRGLTHWILHFSLGLLAIFFLWVNPKRLQDNHLYYYDARGLYRGVSDEISTIPATDPVWISEEAFYPGYLLLEKGYDVSWCPPARAQWYIKTAEEPLPPEVEIGYRMRGEFLEYLLFEKK